MNVTEENGITHLDLHGLRHAAVFDEVIDFVFQYQNKIPLMIICGNSNKMIELVQESLKSNSIMFSMPRFGIIRVEKL
tara:strand:+ start:78 stop:311 length:234 start_codon:yes stop_codon:yes gene_type:complete